MEFFEFASAVEAMFVFDPLKNYLWAYLAIGALGFAVFYIFETIALYTIAVKNGNKHKWMAFIPVLNTYYIGVLSEKNKVYNRVKPATLSAIMAALEAVCITLGVLYYVATFKIFKGGYAEAVYTPIAYMGTTMDVLEGYKKVDGFPVELEWAWWMAMRMPSVLQSWFDLAYTVIGIFVLVAFFRTYSSTRYFIFVIFSILFPIKGVFMFAVRNNAAKNYGEYLREQQQARYRMYQQYRQNGTGYGPNGYGPNGYGPNGYGPNGYGNGDPFGQNGQNVPPEDPFGGLGSNGTDNRRGRGNGADDDPFN